jgi:hypothetical protein
MIPSIITSCSRLLPQNPKSYHLLPRKTAVMVRIFFLSALAALATSAAANPKMCPCPPSPPGPKIEVAFYSDTACKKPVFPVHKPFHAHDIFSGHCTNNFPHQTYSSLIIKEIDNQFIGQNAALQVGNADTFACDFTKSIKFSIATRDQLGKCQFIGIPQPGPGKPLLPGNEYQIAPLQ